MTDDVAKVEANRLRFWAMIITIIAGQFVYLGYQAMSLVAAVFVLVAIASSLDAASAALAKRGGA